MIDKSALRKLSDGALENLLGVWYGKEVDCSFNAQSDALFIAALSFLGLGIQPPLADWGSMVRETATLINYNDITPLLPAIAIAGLTVAVNFVVDWMLHLSSGLRSDSH